MRSSKLERAAARVAPPPPPAPTPITHDDVRGMSLTRATAAVMASDKSLSCAEAQEKAGALLRRPFHLRPLNEEW